MRRTIIGLILLSLIIQFPNATFGQGLNFPPPGVPTDLVGGWIRTDKGSGFTVVLGWQPGDPSYESIEDPSIKGDTASYKIRREPDFSEKKERIVSAGLGVDNANWSAAGSLNDGFIYYDFDTQPFKTYKYFVSAIDSQTGATTDEIVVTVPIKPDDEICPPVKLHGAQLGGPEIKFFWPQNCDANKYILTIGDEKHTFDFKDKLEYSYFANVTDGDKTGSATLEAWYEPKKDPEKRRKVGTSTIGFNLYQPKSDAAYGCTPPAYAVDGKFGSGWHLPRFNDKGETVGWFPGKEIWTPIYPSKGTEISVSIGSNALIPIGTKVTTVVSGTGAVGPQKDHTNEYIAGWTAGQWTTFGDGWWVDAMGPRVGNEPAFVYGDGNRVFTVDKEPSHDILIGDGGTFAMTEKTDWTNGLSRSTVQPWYSRGLTSGKHVDGEPQEIAHITVTPQLLGPLEISGYNWAGSCGRVSAPSPIISLLELRQSTMFVTADKETQTVRLKIRAVKVKHTGEEELLANRTIHVKGAKPTVLKAVSPLIDHLSAGMAENEVVTNSDGEAIVFVRLDRKGGQIEVRDVEVDKTEKTIKIETLPPLTKIKTDKSELHPEDPTTEIDLTATALDGGLASNTDIDFDIDANFPIDESPELASTKIVYRRVAEKPTWFERMFSAKAETNDSGEVEVDDAPTSVTEEELFSLTDEPTPTDTLPSAVAEEAATVTKNADGTYRIRTNAIGQATFTMTAPKTAFDNYRQAIRTYTIKTRWVDAAGTEHKGQHILPIAVQTPTQIQAEPIWPASTRWYRPDGVETTRPAHYPLASGLKPDAGYQLAAFLGLPDFGSPGDASPESTGGDGNLDLLPNIIDLDASRTRIVEGEESQLAWTIDRATTASIEAVLLYDPSQATKIGDIEPTGQLTVNPTQSTVYVVTATNEAGTTTRETIVRVDPLVPIVPAGTIVPIKIQAYRTLLDSDAKAVQLPVEDLQLRPILNGWRQAGSKEAGKTYSDLSLITNKPGKNGAPKPASADGRVWEYATSLEASEYFIDQPSFKTDANGQLVSYFTMPENLVPNARLSNFDLRFERITTYQGAENIALTSRLNLGGYLRKITVTVAVAETQITSVSPVQEVAVLVSEAHAQDGQNYVIAGADVFVQFNKTILDRLKPDVSDLAQALAQTIETQKSVSVVDAENYLYKISNATGPDGYALFTFRSLPSLRYAAQSLSFKVGASKPGYEYLLPSQTGAPSSVVFVRPPVVLHTSVNQNDRAELTMRYAITNAMGDVVDWLFVEKNRSNGITNDTPLLSWFGEVSASVDNAIPSQTVIDPAPIISTIGNRTLSLDGSGVDLATIKNYRLTVPFPNEQGYDIELSHQTAFAPRFLVEKSAQESNYEQRFTNIVSQASVACSSVTTNGTQNHLCENAVNGQYDQQGRGWLSNEGVGATLTLTWDQSQTIGRVVLTPRSPTYRSKLKFSDGSEVFVEPMASTDRRYIVNLSQPKTVTSVTFVADILAPGSGNAGLTEIEVYPAHSLAALATLTCSSSHPYGTPDTVYYDHRNEFKVGDTYYNNDPDYLRPQYSCDNVVDGRIADRSFDEWASHGQVRDTSIEMKWAEPQAIDMIRLYDRFNHTDHVLSGTLTFSDGTSVSTGTLPNDGQAKTFIFPEKKVTWVRFTVDRANGHNIGLAEFEIFGSIPVPTPPPIPTELSSSEPTVAPTDPSPSPAPTVTPIPTVSESTTTPASPEPTTTPTEPALSPTPTATP